jgi:uncharacterized protein with GYD domain
MARYIMALTINPNAKKEHPDLSHLINDSIEMLARNNIKVETLFATLGRFDFLALFDAEDQSVVFKAASDINNLGILDTETWPVIPFEEFTRIFE